MNQELNEEIEIDFLEIFYLLRSKAVFILIIAIVAATATGFISKYCISPKYSSTSKLYVLTKSTSVTSFADIQVGTSLTTDYMELINSRPVIEQVIDNLHLQETYESLVSKVSVANPSNTRILSITVEYGDPQMAKKIVDNVANVCKVRISNIMEQSEPNVIEEGYVNDHPVSPNIVVNTIAAGCIFTFLTIAVLIVRFLFNDKIKSPDDIEKYLHLNTLAMIPFREEEEE